MDKYKGFAQTIKVSRIKLHEEGCTFYLENPNRRVIIVVDVQGFLGQSGKNCDGFYIDKQSHLEIYVELKGNHVEDAFKQVAASIPRLTSEVLSGERIAVIVHSPNRNPRLKTTREFWQKEFQKKFTCQLITASTEYTLNLEDHL